MTAATPRSRTLPLLGALVLAAAAPPAFGQEAAPAPKPEAGTLNIPAFSYPPSVLTSEEQKRAYAASLASPGNGTISMPTDPKIVAMMRTVVNNMFAKSLPFVQQRYPVETTEDTIGGVQVIRVKPKGGVKPANRRRVLIEVHGGSFMVGWPSVALLDAIPVAALSGIEVIAVNYRMFPEVQHPAALEDLTKVYREVLKTHRPANIGVFGGSAGGVITLQSIPWFAKQGLPRPAAIAPLAAAFQTATGDSAIWNFSGGFSPPGTTLVQRGGYFGKDYDRRNIVPEITPESFASYPPTLWMAGTRAPELSGVATGHASLLKRGVASELYLIEGGWHQSYSTAPDTPESQDAMRYIAGWFDRRLGK
jgi:acetyl esterase/lipase